MLELLNNPYVSSTLVLILVLYGSLARPKLPKTVHKVFENPIFQIVLFSLIVYRGNHNPQLAVVVATVFMVIMNLITEQKMKQSVEQVENFHVYRRQEAAGVANNY
jgi:hypothetical protein